MTQMKNLTGEKFGRLTVLNRMPHYNGRLSWLCRCDCGGSKITDSKALRTGAVSSCGCARKSHGQSNSPLHKVWTSMRERCSNPASKSFKHYGARGIKVCERWNNFELFLSDMGPRPPNHSIERDDNDKDYEPSNCYWATQSEQMNNTTRSRHLTAGGKTMTMAQWARQLNGSSDVISRRLQYGWTVEQACLTPIRRKT